MSGIGYYTRLAAALFVAAAMGAAIANPDVGRKAADRRALAKLEKLNAEERACAPGEAPLTAGFADLDDIKSATPLGALAAPGEAPPAPYLRLTTQRRGGAPVTALAPGKGEVVALERRTEIVGGRKRALWTVRFKPCDRISVFYDRLDAVDPALLRRAGGLQAFEEVAEGRLAVAVRLKVDAGAPVGFARAFDVGLADAAAPVAHHADPSHARTTPPAPSHEISAALERALAFDETRSRCAFDYLAADLMAPWMGKLGDGAGRRLKPGENACVADVLGPPVAARGVWFTDSSHNARARKVSAVALYEDLVDPERLVFSLHGRMPSLSAPGGVVSAAAGDGRLNAPFRSIKPGETYCYQDLRVGLEGPALAGVLVLRLEAAADGPGLLRMEARADVRECFDMPEPWGFTGGETSFYP